MKCLQMKDYHLGVKAFQVSELGFFTIIPVFVTDVSQKLFLFHKFNFCFFFQVEIYILFKYIFLWNQVSLDGELVCHPSPPCCSVWHAAGLWLSCRNLGSLTTCVTSSVLTPSLKQGGFSGDGHLYVPLFEILGFLFKDLLYTIGKLVYRSVIMEILESYVTPEWDRTGLVVWGFFLLWRAAYFFIPLEGIQIHLFGSLLLLELYDYSLNFHCSITCL